MTAERPTRKNRRDWNASSDEYQMRHGRALSEAAEAWGVWRIPESELGVLDEVADRGVLELGCGAAQWSIALAERGARVVGIDLSECQLVHAARRAAEEGIDLRLVHGNAEMLPFADSVFDIVFCDHGAMSFAHPDRTVAEVSRVLRPGGLLAFCMSTPIRDICWDEEIEGIGERLVEDYFGMLRFEDDESVFFQLGYGDWIRLFRRNGLEIEDLIELRPSDTASTTYTEFVPHGWARKWPAENIWKVRKRDHPGTGGPTG